MELYTTKLHFKAEKEVSKLTIFWLGDSSETVSGRRLKPGDF